MFCIQIIIIALPPLRRYLPSARLDIILHIEKSNYALPTLRGAF